jgi:hypothetical protein
LIDEAGDGTAPAAAEATIGDAIARLMALPRVAQRLNHRQHLFKRDEAAAVLHLVPVNRASQLGCFGRQFLVTIGKLTALKQWPTIRLGRAPSIDERIGGDCRARRHAGYLLDKDGIETGGELAGRLGWL